MNIYCRKENSPAFLPPTAIILALISAGFMVGWSVFPAFILAAGNFVIVTAVAFAVLAQWRAASQ